MLHTLQEGSCNGDSGSPVIRRKSGTSRKNIYYEQHFIVSDGVDCDLKATIFTRVSNREILLWIQKVTDTSPLLMVVGGFNSEKGLISDVEVISAKPSNVCSKFVRPIFGKVSKSKYNLGSKNLLWSCSFFSYRLFNFQMVLLQMKLICLGILVFSLKMHPVSVVGKTHLGYLPLAMNSTLLPTGF